MKKISVLLILLPSFIFAGAYFYGNTIQYLGPNNSLNGNFYFAAYKENIVYLESYEVNVPIKEFVNSLLKGDNVSKIYANKFIFLKSEKYVQNGKYTNKKINLPKKIGIYYFKITNSNKFLASSFIFISNLKAININDGERKLIYLRNSETGDEVPKATVILADDNKFTKLNLSNGVIDLSKFDYSNVYIYTDKAFTALYNFVRGNSKFAVYITTDRPVYRPGQKINFKGFFLERKIGKFKSISNQKMEVKVKDPNGSLIYDKSMKTNSFGTTNGSLILGNDAYVGYYSLIFSFGKYHFNSGFYVQAYKKPDFSINITSDKKTYIYKDKMNFTISLKYFNEQPVVGAKTAVYVYIDKDDFSYYNQDSKLIYYNDFITDSNGKIHLPIILSEKSDGKCRIEVVASDETQREIDKTYSVKIYQGNVDFKFERNFYNVKPNKKFEVNFEARDLKGNPLSGTLSATFCGKKYETNIENGHGYLSLIAKSIGNYPLVVKFKGCRYTAYVYSYEFSYENYKPADITIFTDKDSYLPGKKIKIALYGPEKLNGLLAIAGEKLYCLRKIGSSGNHDIETLEIPENIGERNLWVVYIPFSASEKKYYTHKFSINLQDKNLIIGLKTNKKTYKPGEKVELKIKTDPNTNIAISVVDKAIYSVMEQNNNIFDEIYPEFQYPHMEFSFSSNYIPYNLISKLQTPNIFAETKKDYKFASFKSKQTIRNNVRKYFPDTALWIPSKILQDGKVTLEFKLPDSLTTWKIRAVGISKTLKVGETSTEIVSTKEFYIRPILPMFFREGDITRIGASVFNNTNYSTEVNLVIKASENVKISDLSPIKFTIPPHSSRVFFKKCTVTYKSTKSSIDIKAFSNRLNDEILLKIPTYPYTLNRNLYKLMILNKERESFEIPDKNYYNLKINIYSTFKPIIKNSLEKLITYPYGCVEQTMSSFFPAIVSESYGIKFDNLDTIIKKGLVKLFAYQHEDGGWGWWSRDKSLKWMTNYVMNGLFYAKRSGYDVPEVIVSNGIEFIKKHLDGYGVYVLSLYGISVDYFPKNVVDEVYLSYINKRYIKPLISRLVSKNGYSYLDIESNDYMINDVQLNSVFLRSLIKWNENKETIKSVLKYLIYKKDGNFWYDTKDTAFAAIALMEYDKTLNVDLKVSSKNSSKIYKNNSIIIPVNYGKYDFSGSGIVEIEGKYKDIPIKAVSQGISIRREIFKKIEVMGTDPKNNKKIVDAILPLNGNFVPTSIRAKSFSKYFIYNDKLMFKYFNNEKASFDFLKNHFKISSKGVEINGIEIAKGKITSLRATKEKVIVVTKDGYYIYNYKEIKYVKLEKIKDADISKNEIVVLNNDYLKIITPNVIKIVKLNKNYSSVSIVSGKIYLLNDYINLLSDGKIKKLYPVSGDFVCNVSNDQLILSGEVKFLGNTETVGPLGIYEINFQNEDYHLKSGDIVMVKIDAENDGENYILIEDYFPSYAQVLKKYNEKRFLGNYKLDYMWYGDWEYWYVSRELRDQKIGFFCYSFGKNYIKYFYKITAPGEYKVLPTQAYTMYKKGIYGQSNPDTIIVH